MSSPALTAPTKTQSDAPEVSPQDIGLLILRVVLGLLMASHGCQKLFGLFATGNVPKGIGPSGKFFEMVGYHPGKPFAVLAGLSETLGGLGIALGLLTPLAAAALATVMFNAMNVAWKVGLYEANGGYELPVMIATSAIAISFVGPGRFAVDRVLNFKWAHGGVRNGVFSIVLAGVATLLTIVFA
jgi:putative oxidoreductase